LAVQVERVGFRELRMLAWGGRERRMSERDCVPVGGVGGFEQVRVPERPKGVRSASASEREGYENIM